MHWQSRKVRGFGKRDNSLFSFWKKLDALWLDAFRLIFQKIFSKGVDTFRKLWYNKDTIKKGVIHMKSTLISRGYAHETYYVEAEEGEILTKEMVEERYNEPFGCYVTGGNGKFYVDSYTD